MNRLVANLRNNVRSTVWRYYLFSFLKSFAFFSAVLVPFFTEWGQISLARVQFLQSWFMFWTFVLEVPTGVVADYLGRKYSLALGGLVVAVAALVYGSVPRFEVFLLGEFLFGASMALISGADEALLYDALKEAGQEKEGRKYFGRARSVGLLGMLVAAPLGSFIASSFGLNAPMLFSSLPFLLAAFVAWTIREPGLRPKTSESQRYLTIAREGLVYLRQHRKLRLLVLDSVLVATAAYFVIWFYQPRLMALQLPVFYFGYLHALLVAVEMLIASNFSRLENWFGSATRYLRFAALITGLTFLLNAAFPSLITVILFIVVAGGFGLTRPVLMSAYMNRYIPSERRATILSAISMFRRFALVLINPLIGYLADRSLSLAMVLVGLLPLVAFWFSPLKKVELEKG